MGYGLVQIIYHLYNYSIILIPTIFNDFINCKPNKEVLHIGAHICEEKQLYNENGINDDNILWIEANKDLINPEQKNILNAVISDKNDEVVDFIITNNVQSSSILELYKHLEEHPDVIEIGRRNLKQLLYIKIIIFLMIDTIFLIWIYKVQN